MLKPTGYIDLPAHLGEGGFDHAAVHTDLARLYVAHTANNSLDVIDTSEDRYLHSIPGLAGVAGVLVSEQSDLVFSSNRAENSIALFMPGSESTLEKVTVGVRPNGLAFDEGRGLLLSAHVGDADLPASFTVALVDLTSREVVASIPVPGRTRWAMFDPSAEVFYVNISSPSQIAVIDPRTPDHVARVIAVPAAGPHGLDLDLPSRRLFCACDDGMLVCLHADTGEILARSPLSGKPDVIFHNPSHGHLYVAVGDPGVIDLFDARTLHLMETISTEKGAHTLGFDWVRSKIYAFCPATHRAEVFFDPG